MALRPVLEYKKRGELARYYVFMNIEKVLAAHDGRWFRGKPCLLSPLDTMYKNEDQNSLSLSERVDRLWKQSLSEWIHQFDFFKLMNVNGDKAIVFQPKASDVMVDCWYGDDEDHRHTLPLSFSQINPDQLDVPRDWNRCPVCGQLNTFFVLKYEIICAVSPELLERWCKFFCPRNSYNLTENMTDHISGRCQICAVVDCPFAWKRSDNNGGGNRKVRNGAIDFALPASALRRYCNKYNSYKTLNALAQSIEEEDWGYGRNVLRNYIDFTFYNQMSCQSSNGGFKSNSKFAWFNTGLLTCDTLEEVYMCFREIGVGNAEFLDFSWPSNPNGYYQEFEKEIGAPRYIPYCQRADDLLWDDSLELVFDDEHFDHVFFDNHNRIINCRSFLQGRCGFNVIDVDLDQLKRWPKSSRRNAFINFSEEHGRYYANVRELFRNSIIQARKKVLRNYKWVLPIFYPRNKMLTLGLPLFLTSTGTGTVPDIVLLCVKRLDTIEDGKQVLRYHVRTILENNMLYNDARQVCKPYCEWLSQLLRIESRGGPVKVGVSSDDPFVLQQNDEECLSEEQGIVCDFPSGGTFGWIRTKGKRKYRFNAEDIVDECAIKPGDHVRYTIVKRGKFVNATKIVRVV